MSSFELLSAGEVHLYLAAAGEGDDAHAMADCERLLSTAEKQRRDRFHFERDRRQFTLTRALLRRLLSLYRPAVDPAEWSFGVNPFGKPSILHEPFSGLQFNLSHTSGMIVFAIGSGRRIGVDVEWCSRELDVADLAGQVFSEEEDILFQSLPKEGRRDFFFRTWTLKEACVKCLGTGLSTSLIRFSVSGSTAESAGGAFRAANIGELGASHTYCAIVSSGHALSLVVDGSEPVLRKFTTASVLK